MMQSSSEATRRAVKLAADVSVFLASEHPAIIYGSNVRSWRDLLRIAEMSGAHVILGRELPGKSRKAAVVYIESHPFIVIDRTIAAESTEALMYLSHEIGHVILEHGGRTAYGMMELSETMNSDGMMLQLQYDRDIECEANVAGMLLVVPDGYLNELVERRAFISTAILSREHKLPIHWVTSRISLYRALHGYDRTLQILSSQLSRYELEFDPGKWEGCEIGHLDRLANVLFGEHDALKDGP